MDRAAFVGARRRLARPRQRRGNALWRVTRTVVGNSTAASIGEEFPALAGRRVRQRLTPTNGGCTQPSHPNARPGMQRATFVGARRCLARPRQRRGDSTWPTRLARHAAHDQPSGRIDDRPAVNGRAQPPSRLKPADPHGACTQPIDPGAWAPHSPLQGACGLSPGLQPRAFAADHPRRGHHRTAAPIRHALPALAGRTGQAPA
jgi:hypothetical protein